MLHKNRQRDSAASATSGLRMLKEIRAHIVRGVYPPEGRLPSRVEMEQHYRAGPVTVQRVFDQLAREGFVVACGRRGTFVSSEPPHLCAFGLVFPYRDRPDRPWPRFWHALFAEAAKMQRPSARIAFSYGNETHDDIEAYGQLVDDVVNQRLAGLIFASKPFYLFGSPVLDMPGLPRVAMMPEADIPGVHAVTMGGDWVGRTIDILVRAGRRRVAVLTVPSLEPFAAKLFPSRGIETRPYWLQTVHPSACHGARNVVHSIMSANSKDRPDSLLIMDDNLVEAATAGLVDAGVRVPRDITVVASCNFPYPAPSAVPVIRVGHDVSVLLALCLDSLIRQRRGETVPALIHVPLATDEAQEI